MSLWVAFYDHETGEITGVTSGTPRSIVAHRQPFVILPEYRKDWDLTHIVINDQLADRDPEALASLYRARAMVALRVLRNGLLKIEIDPIVTNPLRWDGLSAEKRAALSEYREALLDWPETETDPLNPTPPVAPEL